MPPEDNPADDVQPTEAEFKDFERTYGPWGRCMACGLVWSMKPTTLVACPECGRPWSPFDGTFETIGGAVFMPKPVPNPDSVLGDGGKAP